MLPPSLPRVYIQQATRWRQVGSLTGKSLDRMHKSPASFLWCLTLDALERGGETARAVIAP